MKAVAWGALLVAVSAVAPAEKSREVHVLVSGAPLAFPSTIEPDSRLGLVLRTTPPSGVTLSAELIESPGTKTVPLDLSPGDRPPELVARLPVDDRFTSGHIHYTIKRDGLDEQQFRQFAIRPSARAGISMLQSHDGQMVLYVQSERLDPDTSVILADVGAIDPPLPEGTSAVLGPISIVTTKPGKNDTALGAFLYIALARVAPEKRDYLRVLHLEGKRRQWTALAVRNGEGPSMQAAVNSYGTFVVVSP